MCLLRNAFDRESLRLVRCASQSVNIRTMKTPTQRRKLLTPREGVRKSSAVRNPLETHCRAGKSLFVSRPARALKISSANRIGFCFSGRCEPGALAGTYADASGLTSRSSAGTRACGITHPPSGSSKGKTSRFGMAGVVVLLFLFFFLLVAWKAALFLGGFFGFSVLRFPFPFAFSLLRTRAAAKSRSERSVTVWRCGAQGPRAAASVQSLRSREASAARSSGGSEA